MIQRSPCFYAEVELAFHIFLEAYELCMHSFYIFLKGSMYENVDAVVSGWGTLSSGGSQATSLMEVDVSTLVEQYSPVFRWREVKVR